MILRAERTPAGCAFTFRIVSDRGEDRYIAHGVLSNYDTLRFCIAVDVKADYKSESDVKTLWEKGHVVLFVKDEAMGLNREAITLLCEYIRSESKGVWEYGGGSR